MHARWYITLLSEFLLRSSSSIHVIPGLKQVRGLKASDLRVQPFQHANVLMVNATQAFRQISRHSIQARNCFFEKDKSIHTDRPSQQNAFDEHCFFRSSSLSNRTRDFPGGRIGSKRPSRREAVWETHPGAIGTRCRWNLAPPRPDNRFILLGQAYPSPNAASACSRNDVQSSTC